MGPKKSSSFLKHMLNRSSHAVSLSIAFYLQKIVSHRLAKKRTAFIVAAVAWMSTAHVFGQSETVSGSDNTGTMLWISDIHFNPFYGGETLRLASDDQTHWRNHQEWARILRKMPANRTCSPGGEDANDYLMRSVLDKATLVAAETEPDFILMTGDFLTHDFTDVYFNQSGLPTSLANVKKHNDFVRETMSYIAMTVSNAFEGIPVVAALGNNDAFCGDYDVRGNSGFLESTHATFRKYFLPDLSDDFKKFGGCYVTKIPKTHHKLLVLNSIPFLAKYPDLEYVESSSLQSSACESLRPVQVVDEVLWFVDTVHSLQESQKVWIACHVPPGVDCYGGSQYWSKPISVEQKQEPFVNEFRRLYLRHLRHMAGFLSGHSHMAEFKLIRDEGQDSTVVSSVLMAPSISRNHGNNASFRQMKFNRKTLIVADYVTHWLDASKSPPEWGKPFSFAKTYNQPDVSPSSLKAVYDGMASPEQTFLDQYFRDYSTRNGANNSRARGNYKIALPRILGP